MTTLGENFNLAIKGIVGDAALVLDYGCEEDFRAAWSDEFANGDLNLPVIILWDGREWSKDPQEKCLVPHVTPLDWVLAFCINAWKTMGEKFRIHIVDITGFKHTSWAMKMRVLLLSEMPWVTLHAPLVLNQKRASVGYLPILGEKGLFEKDNQKWNLRSPREERSSRWQSSDELKYFAQQWAATLLRTGDHHDLNNILGPSAIDRAGLRAEGHSYLKAFLQRLHWSELLSNLEHSNEDNKPVFQEPIDILAIDDNIEHGWGGVLARILGLSPEYSEDVESIGRSPKVIASGNGATLFGAAAPQFLLDYLAPDDIKTYTSRNYDSPLTSEEKPWVLVLDIHILTGREENDWAKKLLAIARKIGDIDQNNLAWRGFSQDEIGSIDAYLHSGEFAGDSYGYDLALSLLPRLCALRWPAVPILIFSGTGRRKLMSVLADYGNITLAPPKPNLLGGDGEGEVERFMAGWRNELKKISQLVEVQRKLIVLAKKEEPRITQQNYRHIVIALDEAGEWGCPPSHIGGAFIVTEGNSKQDAIAGSVVAQEYLREAGVIYYDQPPYYLEASEVGDNLSALSIKNKKSKCREAVEGALEKGGFELGVLRLEISLPQNDEGSGQEYSDYYYLKGLSDSLELYFSEYLPSLGYDMDKTSISIWLPSKQGWNDDGRDEALRYDFRLNHNRAETIGGYGSAYAVLLRAIGARRCFKSVEKSIAVLATRAIPYSDPENYQSALAWYCSGCNSILFPKVAKKNANGTRVFVPTCCYEPTTASYSVVQHLADETVTRGSFGNQYSFNPQISFDIKTNNPRVADFLVCTRMFDLKPDIAAFKLAFKQSFFLNQIEEKKPSSAEHGLAGRLIGELSKYAKTLEGNQLIELAGLPVHGFGISSPAIRKSGVASATARAPNHRKNSGVTSAASKSPDYQEKGRIIISGFGSNLTEIEIGREIEVFLPTLGPHIPRYNVSKSMNSGNLTCKIEGDKKMYEDIRSKLKDVAPQRNVHWDPPKH